MDARTTLTLGQVGGVGSSQGEPIDVDAFQPTEVIDISDDEDAPVVVKTQSKKRKRSKADVSATNQGWRCTDCSRCSSRMQLM